MVGLRFIIPNVFPWVHHTVSLLEMGVDFTEAEIGKSPWSHLEPRGRDQSEGCSLEQVKQNVAS